MHPSVRQIVKLVGLVAVLGVGSALTLPAATFTWDNDQGNGRWGAGATNRQNWVGNTNPANYSDIVFDDSVVTSNQAVQARQSDKLVSSVIFRGPYSYTLGKQGSVKLIFSTNGAGASTLIVASSAGGSASHELNLDVQLNNNLTANNQVNQTLTFSQDINLQSYQLTFQGIGNFNVDNNVNGTGSMLMNGTGTLYIDGSNNFSGGFTMNSGTLQIGNNDSTGTGTLTIGGGTLEASGSGSNRSLDNQIVLTGDYTVGGSKDLIFEDTAFDLGGNREVTVNSGVVHEWEGNVSGSGNSLTKAGSGTLQLGGDNSFNGGLIINQGTVLYDELSGLSIGFDGADNSGLGRGTVTVNSGGTLSIDTGAGDDVVLGNTLTLAGGTTNIIPGGDFIINSSGTLAMTSGSFTLTDGDNAILTGDTDIDGGTFSLTVNNDITFNGSGTTDISGGTVTYTTGTGIGDDVLIDSGHTINQTGGTVTFNGDGDFDVDGTLTVSGSSTTMNVNSGNEVTLGGTMTVADGGTIVVDNDVTLDGGTLSGGLASTKGTLEVTGNLVANGTTLSNDPNITLNRTADNSISTTNASTLTGIGTLTIKGSGSATTTIDASLTSLGADKIDIQAGTLLVSADNQITSGTNIELSGGIFNTGGFDLTLGTLTLTADSTIDLGGGNSILNFADSSGTTWNASATLTIVNWSGDSDGGGTDQILFASQGLTSTQLGQIRFLDPAGFDPGTYDAFFIGDEIVPIPEPGSIFAGIAAMLALILKAVKRRFSKAE